jgi:hypothetical protein
MRYLSRDQQRKNVDMALGSTRAGCSTMGSSLALAALPRLPEALKAGIVAMVKAAGGR